MPLPVPAPADRHAYLIGGGIASLAAAVFFIRDGQVPGPNIHIFEQTDLVGGSLDGSGQADAGYVLRGGRMLNFSYRCTYELLDSMPSLEHSAQSVTDDILAFNLAHKTHAQARLVDRNGGIVDVTAMGFSEQQRLALVGLLAIPELLLGTKRVNEWFDEAFFASNFWFMWATMFAFQPWHSVVEFKRYLLRFLHEFWRIETLTGVDRTPYNQHDAIVLPLLTWLQDQGVEFRLGSQATDLDFPPQLSVAVYFVFWYSLQHVLRLLGWLGYAPGPGHPAGPETAAGVFPAPGGPAAIAKLRGATSDGLPAGPAPAQRGCLVQPGAGGGLHRHAAPCPTRHAGNGRTPMADQPERSGPRVTLHN